MDNASDVVPETDTSRWRYRPSFDSWFDLARHVVIGGVAGVAAGLLIGGVGSRIFMRVAGAASGGRGARRTTEAGFRVGDITIDGTLGLVIFVGLFAGIVGAALYLAARPFLGWAGRWRGLAFGLVLFALTSATSDIMNPDNPDFIILGNQPLVVAMIVVLFITFGVTIDWLFGWLDARLPDGDGHDRRSGALYVAIAGLGALLSFATVPFVLFQGESVCDCAAPLGASWSFVAVIVAAAILWVGSLIEMRRGFMAGATALGYVGLAGTLGFGLVRAVSDAVDIIT